MALMISYIASGIATVLGMIEPFGKKMQKVLILSFLGNFCVGISYLLGASDSRSGALICFIACIQVTLNYIFNVRGKKVPYWLIGIYIAAFLSVNIIGFAKLYDLFALAASMCFVIGMVQTNPKYYRILYVTNSMLWIAYDIFAKARGNLFAHIALFTAISLAIYVRDKRKQN